MHQSIVLPVIMLMAIICLPKMAIAEDGNENKSLKSVKAVIIECKGMIDDGLYKSIKRRTNQAIDGGADYVFYEISTYGGLVKSADDISKFFILEAAKSVKTVAYVTTEAISAGAMISVSCQDIIMAENTTIGDCAPIVMKGKLEGVEREKSESFVRVTFKRAAEANNYPEALLTAMVTMQMEVWQVENKKTGESEYFAKPHLPTDGKQYDIKNKKLIVPDDQILTITAEEAVKLGIARAKVADLNQMLEFFQKRDNVKFQTNVEVLENTWSEELYRWINSPTVMGILIMAAMLGVYTELRTPGIGVAGLMAAICFAIIVGSKFMIDLANWIEIAVMAVGILLLLIELVVIPGFGITGGAGIILIMVSLFAMMIKNPPEQIPWPQNPLQWQLLKYNLIGLLSGVFGFVIVAAGLSKFLPKTKLFSGLELEPSENANRKNAPAATYPESQNAPNIQVGAIGKAMTDLHPAGKAKFDEAVVDVVTQAEFIDEKIVVEIMKINGNKVVVRKHK